MPWLVAASSLVLIYPLAFWATGFYVRYLAPLLICLLPLTAVMCAARLATLSGSRVTAGALVLASAVLFFAAAVFTFHTGRIENSHSITAGFIKKHYPSARVGAFQSGVIGYFNENVLNLDGKMDLGALRMKQQGRLEEYIESIEADVIVDWGNSYIRKLLSARWLESRWNPCPVRVPDGRTLCFVRLGPDGLPRVSPEGIAGSTKGLAKAMTSAGPQWPTETAPH